MTNFFIALICGATAAVWVSNKFMRTTGGNTSKAIGGGAMVGLLAFVLVIAILSIVG